MVAASSHGELSTWLVMLAALPFAVVLLACFVKVAVVLSILQSALGSAIPPRSVTTAVALLLATFVVAPVGERMWTAAATDLSRADPAALLAASSRAREPLREFLSQHTRPREREAFVELARRLRPAAERAAVADNDLLVLAPAFVIGELKVAFEVGFLLFLPFLVLELLVASVLSVLGMHALDPRGVSLPFKLLLFVLADGWHLLSRGLILAYT